MEPSLSSLCSVISLNNRNKWWVVLNTCNNNSNSNKNNNNNTFIYWALSMLALYNGKKQCRESGTKYKEHKTLYILFCFLCIVLCKGHKSTRHLCPLEDSSTTLVQHWDEKTCSAENSSLPSGLLKSQPLRARSELANRRSLRGHLLIYK